MVVCTCDPGYVVGFCRRIAVQSQPLGKNMRPYLKNTEVKKNWGMAQELDHVDNKSEALRLNPSTAQNKLLKRTVVFSISTGCAILVIGFRTFFSSHKLHTHKQLPLPPSDFSSSGLMSILTDLLIWGISYKQKPNRWPFVTGLFHIA
jgi:hypothetical protein